VASSRRWIGATKCEHAPSIRQINRKSRPEGRAPQSVVARPETPVTSRHWRW